MAKKKRENSITTKLNAKAKQSNKNISTLWSISNEELKAWLDSISSISVAISEKIKQISANKTSIEQIAKEFDKNYIEEETAPYKKPLDDDSLELRFGQR